MDGKALSVATTAHRQATSPAYRLSGTAIGLNSSMELDELTELVQRIWFEDMSPQDRSALKQEIAQRLSLQHAHVVGAIDFDDEAESPGDVAQSLLRLAQSGAGGGACGL